MAIVYLDDVAWRYLMGSFSEREEHGPTLIHAGAPAIFPLLRAGVRDAKEGYPSRMDRKTAEMIWVDTTVEPMLNDIYAIVQAVGQPAYDTLCRAFWQEDENLKVLAALVLLKEQDPGSRTTKQIHKAFIHIASNDRDKKQFRQSGVFIILSYILARGSDPEHQQLLQGLIAKHPTDVEEVIRNRSLLFLVR